MIYRQIDAVLPGAALMGAAEAHGILTGMLCVDGAIGVDRWLSTVSGDGGHWGPDARRVLDELFEETERVLLDDDYSFAPLLPDEEESLRVRATALADWCRGFLYGVGNVAGNTELPGPCSEVLRDFVEISKLDPDAEASDDEESYTELSEYVRVGVLLIRSELIQQTHKRRRH